MCFSSPPALSTRGVRLHLSALYSSVAFTSHSASLSVQTHSASRSVLSFVFVVETPPCTLSLRQCALFFTLLFPLFFFSNTLDWPSFASLLPLSRPFFFWYALCVAWLPAYVVWTQTKLLLLLLGLLKDNVYICKC